MTQKVGIVGLGRMGMAAARKFIQDGGLDPDEQLRLTDATNAARDWDTLVWSLAASLSISGSHGGSHTRRTSAPATPSMAATRACTSPGSEPATGQAGEVRVMSMATAPCGVCWPTRTRLTRPGRPSVRSGC